MQAEKVASKDNNEVVFWHYAPALDPKDIQSDEEAQRLLRESLISLVIDARYLNLANTLMPRHASLILFPQLSQGDKIFFEISCPELPQQQDSFRSKFISENVWSCINSITLSQIEQVFRNRFFDSKYVMFIFTIVDPSISVDQNLSVEHQKSLGDTYAYNLLAQGTLIWNANVFRPPDFNTSDLELNEITSLQKHEVQRYVLSLELPPGAMSVLGPLDEVLGLDWKPLLFEQCFRFMRDRMTLLAIPTILAQRTSDIAVASATYNIANTWRHEYNNTNSQLRLILRKCLQSKSSFTEVDYKDVCGRLDLMSEAVKGLDGLVQLDYKEKLYALLKDIELKMLCWQDLSFKLDMQLDDRVDVPIAFRLVLVELIRNAYKGNTKHARDSNNRQICVKVFEKDTNAISIIVSNPADKQGLDKVLGQINEPLPIPLRIPFANNGSYLGVRLCKYIVSLFGGSLVFRYEKGMFKAGVLYKY